MQEAYARCGLLCSFSPSVDMQTEISRITSSLQVLRRSDWGLTPWKYLPFPSSEGFYEVGHYFPTKLTNSLPFQIKFLRGKGDFRIVHPYPNGNPKLLLSVSKCKWTQYSTNTNLTHLPWVHCFSVIVLTWYKLWKHLTAQGFCSYTHI